jgi:hypothetical protein
MAPALASAKTTLVELRVEGPDSTLDAGTYYAVGGSKFKRVNAPDCSPAKGKLKFAGLSALTTLGSAAEATKDLSPVTVAETDFGPQVCGVADLESFGTFPDPTGGWNYWVNNAGGLSSADVAPVENGDSVLWYYARFGENTANDGNVLALEDVPPADDDGTFEVTVVEHLYEGTPVPYEGAEIEGATSVTDEGDGVYEVTVPDGFPTLSAVDPAGSDVRSNHVEVCVGPYSECPEAPGRTIIGGDAKDKISGTAGWDKISTGGRKDKVDLTDGGRDNVNCGGGKDKVVVEKGDKDDKIKKSCEKVKKA